MAKDEILERLQHFAHLVRRWPLLWDSPAEQARVRTEINREKAWVHRQVIEAGRLKTFSVAPPPAVGGLVMRDVDPFDVMFDPPYGLEMTDIVIDMIDETIGVLSSEDGDRAEQNIEATMVSEPIQEGYAFIAMPMAQEDPLLDDVHDSIREAARRCGVHAERVDDPQTNERITDRILESIRRAQFVVADLTTGRPNVYFEAGYAHALGKVPIYVARDGTQLEFDLKDYPVIFFRNMRELKDKLEKRMRAIAR